MAQDRRSLRALAALLPAGALGLSISLASAGAQAKAAPDSDNTAADRSDLVARRLQAIRISVSEALSQITEDEENFSTDPETQLAWRETAAGAMVAGATEDGATAAGTTVAGGTVGTTAGATAACAQLFNPGGMAGITAGTTGKAGVGRAQPSDAGRPARNWHGGHPADAHSATSTAPIATCPTATTST